MIEFLLWFIVACIVGGLIYYLIKQLPLPAPFPVLIQVCVLLIIILILWHHFSPLIHF